MFLYPLTLFLKTINIIIIARNKKESYCINSKGGISPKYELIYAIYGNSYVTVLKNKLMGLMDFNFKEILPPQYKDFIDIADSLYILQKTNNQYVLFSSTQMKILTPEFTHLIPNRMTDRISFSRDSVHFGFLDYSGKLVIPDTFKRIEDFIGDKAVVQINGKIGIIDINKEIGYSNPYMKQ